MTTNRRSTPHRNRLPPKRQTITANGKRFVLIEPSELRRLERLAAKAEAESHNSSLDDKRPEFPPPDARGNRPAVAFARASVARSVYDERTAAGLSQQELARLSGVRQETISRIESGKHSPTIRTIEKIDRVLQVALKKSGQQLLRR